MRKYQQEHLQWLQQSTTTEENGVIITHKPASKGTLKGHIDVFEEKCLDLNWVGGAGKQDNQQSAGDLIQGIRDSMGCVNYNLNQVEIISDYDLIASDDRNIKLWRYYPRKSYGNRPAVMFVHGGGWIGGTVYVVENFCRLLAELIGGVVFSVDYSLAPERPFPNGFNDCYNSLEHIVNNSSAYGIDANRVFLAGDSAGANLCSAVSLRCRNDNGVKVAGQFLIYLGGCICIENVDEIGYKWNEDDFDIAQDQQHIKALLGLGIPQSIKDNIFAKMYVGQHELTNVYINPIFNNDNSNLPMTRMYSAQYDGLTTQAKFYAKLLAKDGVDVKLTIYQGMTHAFIDRLGLVPQAEDCCMEIAREINNYKG